MKLADVILIYGGGVGSGCHGPNCGRPKGSEKDSEPKRRLDEEVKPKIDEEVKPKKSWKSEHKNFGKANSKMVAGVFVNGGAMAHIYKSLLPGTPIKLSDLQQSLADAGIQANLMGRLRSFHIIGGEVNSWGLVFNKADGTVQMVSKHVGAEKNAEHISGDMYKAAQTAVAKILSNKGLSNFKDEAIKEYLKEVLGTTNYKWFASSISSWSGSPHGASAQYLRKVANDFMGADWSKEFFRGNPDYTKKQDFQNDPNFKQLHDQAVAIKALAGAYFQATGQKEIYRGLHAEQGKAILADLKDSPNGLKIAHNALAGYSTSLDTSAGFGSDVVLRMDVDPDRIWASQHAIPQFSFGSEKEVLVGFKDKAPYYKREDIWVRDKSHPLYTKNPPWDPTGKTYKYGDY